MKEGNVDQLPGWAREVLQSMAAGAPQPAVSAYLGHPGWPLFVAAALVVEFVPRDLVPDELSGSERRAAERELLCFAEPTRQLEGVRWSLTREARREVLASSDASQIAAAAQRTSGSFHDPLTVALRDCILGTRKRNLASMTAEELEVTRVAVTWLRGLRNVDLPRLEELDRRIALQRLLAPFERMIGRVDFRRGRTRPDRFFGRREEMEDLRAYVDVVAADTLGATLVRAAKRVQRVFTGRQPKVVWGSGGVGKTTLVAKFMLEHARAKSSFPFAYLDFDRSTISARNRAGLLAEMCSQVAAQFEQLASPLTALHDTLAVLARRVDVNADADSLTALLPHARSFRRIIDDAFPSSTPFLLVFDTFEIVQYGPDQVVALEKLITAFTGGDADAWPRLRLILSGRQAVPEFLGSVEELRLGALDRQGSAEMFAALAADAGKPISRDEALLLVQAIVKHVPDPTNTGVRPLRLRLIGDLFREGSESGAAVVKGLLDDLAKPPGEQGAVGRALVDGILIRRILNHVRDPRVGALADPGLVVRRITPAVIRDVMTRGTAAPVDGAAETAANDPEEITPWIVDDAKARDIFSAFARELTLVDREGDALRHRQDVRQDMLPLIHVHRPRGFARIHRLAYDHFRVQALADRADTISAAEAIYHGLWLRKPYEDLETLWPKGAAFDPRIDPREFPEESKENVYLRAKKRAPLTPAEIAQLPSPIAAEWLVARGDALLSQQRLEPAVAEIRAAGGEQCAAFDAFPDVAAIAARVLYRAGLWSEAASLLRRHLARSFATPRREASVSILRLWATLLAKTGAEPEQLARLLPFVATLGDPMVRVEILAHITLGLEDSRERRSLSDVARGMVIDEALRIRQSTWRRELRILRLVLATRCRGAERLARTYLSECDRLAHDPKVLGIIGRWRGQPFEERDFDRIVVNERPLLLKGMRFEDVPQIAGSDHSDWIVPFGNALTRDFDRYRRAIDKALRGFAPADVAPHVQRAVKTHDGNSLLEVVVERGMLRIAQEIRASAPHGTYPQSAAQMADVLLRWHRITSGEPLELVPVELRSVADLLGEADWRDLVPRLLAFATHEVARGWPRDPWNAPDPAAIVGEAVGAVVESAEKAEAASSLFLAFARQIEATAAKYLVDDFLELIAVIDWENVVPRLLVYAHQRLVRHGRAAYGYGSQASDYVQEAVRRFIDQSRNFPRGERTSVVAFLCSVIDSLISHEAERNWRRGPHLVVGVTAADEISEELLPSGADFTDELLARNELERFVATLDPDLARYAQALANHQDATAEELAGILRTSVEDVRNLAKRLKRRRKDWPTR
jgi:DNA-directed RNA polymerase specialized sigma24 family protein/DnaJ-domain-containing protein 1